MLTFFKWSPIPFKILNSLPWVSKTKSYLSFKFILYFFIKSGKLIVLINIVSFTCKFGCFFIRWSGLKIDEEAKLLCLLFLLPIKLNSISLLESISINSFKGI